MKSGKTIGSIFGSTFLIILGILVLDSEPKAIDVYRGKTELQINMKVINDKAVPIDSVVVWKN